MDNGLRDIISGMPEEEKRPMGDLAQAIVNLARAAEKRKGARADLIEATDTIAKAIRKELRSGDEVSLEIHEEVRGAKTTGTVRYQAARVQPKGRSVAQWQDALLRDYAILGLSDAQGEYISNPTVLGSTFHPATAAERESFVLEAESVVTAFRVLLENEARDYGTSASKATKLTPR